MSAVRAEGRLMDAKVLMALGELDDAEAELATHLDEASPHVDLNALSLVAKIKHMRGELSEAVACWGQLYARSPHNEIALMKLAVLLQLARDPNAGDPPPLGPPDEPSTTVLTELQTAFRQLVARRPDQARQTCDRLAAQVKNEDREAYKLCIIAKAWIAELSGGLHHARQTLEDLGKERGFETDTDRVLALARVYERSGDPAQLEKAAHVYRFLERSFAHVTAQSRLAALNRTLGRAAEADEYERKFLLGFEKRMHRPSRAEIARVAARRYIPLAMLSRIEPSSDASREVAEPRARALFDYLSGEMHGARAFFESSHDLLDRKYLAELQADSGETDLATNAFIAALEEDPRDPHVIAWLVARWERTGDRAIANALRGTPLGLRVREDLSAALRARPRRARLWLTTASLHDLLGDAEEAARHRRRGSLLEAAQRRDAHPIGRVLAAAVYRFVGKSKGLVHEIWADRRPTTPGRGGFLHTDDVLGNVTPDMQRAVRNTFLAVREYARSHFPHLTTDILDYDYTYKVTKEDEPSGGLSAGLPTALAFLSVFLQRPVPQDVAWTGVVVADAHDVLAVRSVGDAEFKVKAAYHRGLRMIVLPSDNQIDLAHGERVPRAVQERLVRHVGTLGEAIALTWGEALAFE